MRSFCAETLIHSPAAIEIAPATAPAMPARRTIDVSTPGRRESEHQRHIRHQAVVDAEDRGEGETTRHGAVTRVRIARRHAADATRHATSHVTGFVRGRTRRPIDGRERASSVAHGEVADAPAPAGGDDLRHDLVVRAEQQERGLERIGEVERRDMLATISAAAASRSSVTTMRWTSTFNSGIRPPSAAAASPMWAIVESSRADCQRTSCWRPSGKRPAEHRQPDDVGVPRRVRRAPPVR